MMDPFLQSLEFDRILALISLEAKTSAGRDSLSQRRPAHTLEECERRQAELWEMSRFYHREGLLPFGGLTDVAPFFRREELLELNESWQVLRTIRATQALRETLVRSRDSYPLLTRIAAQIDDMGEIVENVGRFFTRDGKLRSEASAELRTLRTRIISKRNAINKTLTELMNRHVDAVQEPIITIRGDRYCIPVKTESRAIIPGILHERSGSGASLFIEPMQIVEMNNDLAELLQQEREEIARITRYIAQSLVGAAPQILAAVEIAGELDSIQACAVVGSLMSSHRPLFTTERELRILDGRHPLLDERLVALRRSAFGEQTDTRVVPVSITLTPQQPALLITGPNAGGKTVALKTAGLIVAMAASGLPVPASDGTLIPVVDATYVLIGDDQNVLEHLSTYTAYLVRLKRVVERATDRSLVLLDELGSGTDPEEGSAIAASVIEHVLACRALLIVTTHLSALKTFAIGDDRVVNAGMQFDPDSGRPTFQMILGVPGRSRAIEVAEMIGMPRSITSAAREKLGQRYGEVDTLLAQMQKKLAELTEQAAAATTRHAEAESALAEIEREREQIREERRKLAAKFRDEMEQLKDDISMRVQGELRHLRTIDRKEREKASAQQITQRVVEPIARRTDLDQEPRGEIKVGDKVEHRRLKLQGQVVSIDRNRVQISVGGRNVTADLPDLVKLGEGKMKESKSRVSTETTRAEEPEIAAELNLVGYRVEDAIEESDKFIDRALMDGKQAVRLIHGFGTGTLRKALREYLRKHRGVKSFRPGSPNEGGDGATVAVLDV